MNTSDFVACWRREKDSLSSAFLDSSSRSEVAAKIASLNLEDSQLALVREIIDGVLTDVFYSLLLGLDGAASIGGVQQAYRILAENGELVSECGDLEAEAWSQFHDAK